MPVKLKICFVCIFALLLSGCGIAHDGFDFLEKPVVPAAPSENSSVVPGSRDSIPLVLTPEASGKEKLGKGDVAIDVSNKNQGYVMVKYQGDNEKVKLRITGGDKNTYTYDLSQNVFETFPLTSGDGKYKLEVFENTTGDKYKVLFTKDIKVTLEDEFLPYLYPSQYVNFEKNSACVEMAQTLAKPANNDLEVISSVYYYVVKTVAYDYDKADTVKSGYLPNVDETLATKKGICFDYAALMTAMLRSQRIPSKLVIGYSGAVYHAWISVYTKETGWIENAIQFNGSDWTLMDPTFASTSGSAEYAGEGNNYNGMYIY